MKNFAQITDGLVGNIIVCDDAKDLPEDYKLIPDGVLVSIGWKYENGLFINPIPDIPQVKTPDQAWAEGSAFITQYFDPLQISDCMMQLNLPTASDVKKQAIMAVYGWIEQIKSAWNADAANFDTTKFSPPPCSYKEIVDL